MTRGEERGAMVTEQLKAPFPYFGGKAQVADCVWNALGDPKHYLEPFFGSGAVLLARPHAGVRCETVCDKDGLLCNVWRALQAAPDEVAKWADWPVNHVDLNARRRVLIAEEPRLLEKLTTDDAYFNAKLAGYWVWAASCWIGGGLTRPNSMPRISNLGAGIHSISRRPHVASGGEGIHAIGQIPHVIDTGKGIHCIGGGDMCRSDADVRDPYNANVFAWFRRLSERLRYVRVVCGDWTRICGGSWQTHMGTCGIFFDPPYGVADRRDVYHHESLTVSHEVGAWALERASDPRMRIVIAGYDDEHPDLLAAGWTMHKWSAQGGYANRGESIGKENRHRETLFLSPHCVGSEIEDLPARSPLQECEGVQ